MSELTYHIDLHSARVDGTDASLFRVRFGADSENDRKVVDAEQQIAAMVAGGNLGGKIALINGPASLPVAVVLAHHLIHRFGVLGVFDPKVAGYVVAAAHGSTYKVGDTIPAKSVSE